MIFYFFPFFPLSFSHVFLFQTTPLPRCSSAVSSGATGPTGSPGVLWGERRAAGLGRGALAAGGHGHGGAAAEGGRTIGSLGGVELVEMVGWWGG